VETVLITLLVGISLSKEKEKTKEHMPLDFFPSRFLQLFGAGNISFLRKQETIFLLQRGKNEASSMHFVFYF
jgi:hypothetical protein